MIEHLLDEGLLMVALRDGRGGMNSGGRDEAKLTEEIGAKQPVAYTEARSRGHRHPRGRARHGRLLLGKDRRLEVLSIIKRRGRLGLLAHSELEERFTRPKSEIE